ncbi:MAG: WecB/TagA/CpsF family glycosyltransferase [Candidatus Omnitrophica bacterium]|nr:WecB/TagA/CpsF family glycosyltransferase [Candidatus Omnitrophota bacterium]
MKIDICGAKIDNVTFIEAIEESISLSFCKDKYHFIVTPNVDHLMQLQRDSDLKMVYDNAALVLTDGMPIIWLSKFLGKGIKEKISGSDLLPKLCEVASDKGLRIFFLGGRLGSVESVEKAFKNRYRGINIVRAHCPSFGFEKDEVENRQVIELIKEVQPDILFVGLGTPKQEKWIYRYRDEYKVPLSIGIGASFDFEAGVVKRAPLWMRKVGFEWFWRILMEPKRLWKRYLIDDMQFFWLVLKQKVGKK